MKTKTSKKIKAKQDEYLSLREKKIEKQYLVSPADLKKRKTTKSIDDVVVQIFKRPAYQCSIIDNYHVPFNLVHTEDLIVLLQNLTISCRLASISGGFKLPSPNTYERLNYLKEMNEYIDISHLGDKELNGIVSMIQCQDLINNSDKYVKLLKTELSTREHIPRGHERKIIRRLKAQGRYVVD